jgi:hypothetical protein
MSRSLTESIASGMKIHNRDDTSQTVWLNKALMFDGVA